MFEAEFGENQKPMLALFAKSWWVPLTLYVMFWSG